MPIVNGKIKNNRVILNDCYIIPNLIKNEDFLLSNFSKIPFRENEHKIEYKNSVQKDPIKNITISLKIDLSPIKAIIDTGGMSTGISTSVVQRFSNHLYPISQKEIKTTNGKTLLIFVMKNTVKV